MLAEFSERQQLNMSSFVFVADDLTTLELGIELCVPFLMVGHAEDCCCCGAWVCLSSILPSPDYEDIPLLAEHFVQTFAKRQGKSID